MDNNTAAQLRLKPSGLGRHNVAAVGDVDELLHRNGVECKGYLHLTAVHPLLQLAEASDTTNKVDAFVPAEILDAQHLVQHEVRQHGNIQNTDGVVIVVGTKCSVSFSRFHRSPLSAQ